MGRIYDATWGRIFSAIYDPLLKKTEESGLRDIRRELLSQAGGVTIDLGAGTGANVGLSPEGLARLVFAEPDPHMIKRLRARLAEADGKAEVMEAPAEDLSLQDDSFDTAAFTLVLCTVSDPAAALAEAARVLKPDGKLLFAEHVRGEDGLARWQDRLEVPWRYFADGCHCNRDTVATIGASAFTIDWVEHGEMAASPPIVKPQVWGGATLAA